MDNVNYIKAYLDDSIAVKKLLQESDSVLSQISLVADLIINAYKNGIK
jgi:D-sedoheptulose 7-phosphate isomerase